MARQKKPVHRVQMTEGKRNIIRQLLEEYDIENAEDAIESLNSTYRRLNRQRSVFPSDTALLKALYLATFEATKRWTSTIRNWGQVYGELSIMYENRLPE